MVTCEARGGRVSCVRKCALRSNHITLRCHINAHILLEMTRAPRPTDKHRLETLLRTMRDPSHAGAFHVGAFNHLAVDTTVCTVKSWDERQLDGLLAVLTPVLFLHVQVAYESPPQLTTLREPVRTPTHQV